MHSGDGTAVVPIYDRVNLAANDSLSAPAIVCDHAGTTVVDPGWKLLVLPHGELFLEREISPSHVIEKSTHDNTGENASSEIESDSVLLEIFNNQFAGVAEEMGAVLKATSSSVNVKERLDYSCAIFTPEGQLVVNAPHIPVHLGAMSLTVRALLEQFPQPAPGDVYITNDPFRGGSHLPDVTLVTPVFDDESHDLLFFTASRAHHAELGGIAPGSMPPFSKNLAEEGVLIRGFKLFDAGRPRWEELEATLRSGPYPSRNVKDNLADVRAQIAANRRGVEALSTMIQRSGRRVVHAYMRHIQTAAERKTRQALQQAPQGVRTFVDHLDDGSKIQVALTIKNGAITIDFTGTSPVLAGNLNANRAITSSATLYCLRLLIDEDIPLNEGVLAPATLVIPECLLNPTAGPTPEQSPAVVGGNVETSQRVVDVLLGALGLAAASQGTMNNLTFGDGSFGYYETICGGSGATATSAGADAVHTHMTNTRLTDPEVLEHRFPVRLVSFQIRRGSGGAGKHRGGDGVIRTLRFLKPLRVSLLTQRRGPYAPYGVNGGEPGALGRNLLRRAASPDALEDLGGSASFEAEAGDELTIETPGAGGWGRPADSAS
ncbi:MAG TPA: hydantoinase B/oxoprolinase family protein, partial [Pirellulales bacterium]